MDFVKKNYEKILLGFVLFGLVAAVVFLLILVGNEKQRLDDLRNSIINRPVRPLEPPLMTDADILLQRATHEVALDFGEPHRVFNPLRWVKNPTTGQLIKMMAGSITNQLQVTKSTPLYYTVSLDSVSMTESGARYGIGVDEQAGSRPKGKQPYYMSVGEKKGPFILREVKGPPDNPTAVVLEFVDSGDQISISKEKPYRRVDGYMVDLKYLPENRTFPNRRVDSTINFGGSEYKVVAITQDEVVLSAPNQKKWTIRFSAAP
jgi:hypothetical protein